MALKHLLAGAALIALMAQPALAQSQDTTQQQPQQQLAQATQQQLAQADIKFAKKAAGDGMAEVKLGQLAQQQTKTEQVNQFGERMVDDHSKANDELKSVAQEKGIELPQDLPAQAQQAYDELQQKSGHEFDQAYMDMMVEDHQKAVDLFQREAKSGKDADLQKFAEQTLPVLEEHLQLAEQTQKQVMAAANKLPGTDAQSQQRAAPREQRQAATQAEQPVSLEKTLGADVVNAAGDEIGEVKDVVLDRDGAYYAILSVGGFLGIGGKKVAVPLDEMKLADDQVYLMANATKEQLEQMPEYDEQQYRPYAEQHGLLQ